MFKDINDNDIYYLLLNFLHTDLGGLIIILAFLLLLTGVCVMLMVDSGCNAMINDCKDILSKNERKTFK